MTKNMNGISFFTLFGCRIAIPPPPPDQESDVGPSEDLSRAIVAVDVATESEASLTSEILCPEPLRSYNPYDNSMHDYSSSSSTTGPFKPRRKYQKRKWADGDDSERVRRRRRREPQQPRSDLSPEFLRVIGSARPVFLYRKRLEMSDVEPRQNRLLVNETGKLKEFLTEEEMGKSKVDVTAVDEKGTEFKMTLSKWGEKDLIKKKKKKSVVFHKQWNLMLRTKGVEIDDSVDVWGFRRGPTNEFCLALAFSRG